MRPLYDRYRAIKRMLAKPMSVSRVFEKSVDAGVVLLSSCVWVVSDTFRNDLIDVLRALVFFSFWEVFRPWISLSMHLW